MAQYLCPSCGAARTAADSDCAVCSWRIQRPDPTEAKFRAVAACIEQVERRCRRLSLLLALSVFGLVSLLALVVGSGRFLGIPASAGSFTTGHMQVAGKADVTTIRVKELIILNDDGSAAGSLNAEAGRIHFNRYTKDGVRHPAILFFEGGTWIRVWVGDWRNVATER